MARIAIFHGQVALAHAGYTYPVELDSSFYVDMLQRRP